MSNPDVVPEKLENPINYKIIILILVAGLGIYFVLQWLPEEDSGNLVFALSVGIASAVSAFSFVVSKRYWGTTVFGKSYLFLAMGFLSYAIAEVLYYSFELFLGIEPYPSIADIFFFALYPLALTHLVINIKFFTHSITSKQKILVIVIPIFFIIVYSLMSFTELDEPNFDYYYGIIFVAGASTTFSFAIIGAKIFRQGMLGVAWLLLVVGILINAIGDVWYYNLEIFGAYYDAHPVTVVWYVSNLLMIYALYKHQKII